MGAGKEAHHACHQRSLRVAAKTGAVSKFLRTKALETTVYSCNFSLLGFRSERPDGEAETEADGRARRLLKLAICKYGCINKPSPVLFWRSL